MQHCIRGFLLLGLLWPLPPYMWIGHRRIGFLSPHLILLNGLIFHVNFRINFNPITQMWSTPHLELHWQCSIVRCHCHGSWCYITIVTIDWVPSSRIIVNSGRVQWSDNNVVTMLSTGGEILHYWESITNMYISPVHHHHHRSHDFRICSGPVTRVMG